MTGRRHDPTQKPSVRRSSTRVGRILHPQPVSLRSRCRLRQPAPLPSYDAQETAGVRDVTLVDREVQSRARAMREKDTLPPPRRASTFPQSATRTRTRAHKGCRRASVRPALPSVRPPPPSVRPAPPPPPTAERSVFPSASRSTSRNCNACSVAASRSADAASRTRRCCHRSADAASRSTCPQPQRRRHIDRCGERRCSSQRGHLGAAAAIVRSASLAVVCRRARTARALRWR